MNIFKEAIVLLSGIFKIHMYSPETQRKIYRASGQFPQNWADAHIYLCAFLNECTLLYSICLVL